LGDKNRGLFKSLIKVIYEDLKDFNVYALNVQSLSFQLDTHLEDNDLSYKIDNFPDFINKFEEHAEKLFYTHLIVITINVEIGSKIDILHSVTKKYNLLFYPPVNSIISLKLLQK